ncbi:hypothetical protein [Candidatus Bathycorpusculum sp.]|uniref:hypothetical protein n=1 Tax=Candidatus Bathycorpusculum sp. TaxID=2994959 RepID=UPI0028235AEA|nr:hypothetical protein [Candidatus Termitimicrobium sp.]MCL2431806.1 hypothetical protein [Candidatus Termitimicrobium sp.]
MKIEKKMMTLSIVAFAIGIAVIIPISARMNANAQTFGDEPWFTIENPSAAFAADIIDDSYHWAGGIKFLTSISDYAFSQQADARIEYLKLVVYTDDMRLCESNQFIAVDNSHTDCDGVCDLLEFGNKNWFDDLDFRLGSSGSYRSTCGQCLHSAQLPIMPIPINHYGCGSQGGHDTYKEFGAILDALENTQTIHADIIRVGYITFYENDKVVVTPIDNEVILHMELTRNGHGFTFNDSAPSKLPVPTTLEGVKAYLGIEP